MIGIDFGDNVEPKKEEVRKVIENVKKEKEINLTFIFNCLFTNRNEFSTIPHEVKDKWGFIANRFLSKKFPEFAQTINVRAGDMGMVLNMWWLYLKDKDRSYYWDWIWINGKADLDDIDKLTIEVITDNYPDINPNDIKYLKEWYEDFEEEVELLKKIKKQDG